MEVISHFKCQSINDDLYFIFGISVVKNADFLKYNQNMLSVLMPFV
jgi:hypothetical protein